MSSIGMNVALFSCDANKEGAEMYVMIVDNDEAWTRSLEILLKQRGFEVTAFTEPERACEFIEQIYRTGFLIEDVLPDAVVLDYVMPQMTGFGVLARIASELKAGCVIVFVTGHGDQMKNADFGRLGVAACLEKPVDVDELVKVLEGKQW